MAVVTPTNISNLPGTKPGDVSSLLSSDTLKNLVKPPTLPTLPEVPGISNIPGISSLPSIPGVPDLSSITDPVIVPLIQELANIQIQRAAASAEYAAKVIFLELQRKPIETIENGQVVKKDPGLTEEKFNELVDNAKNSLNSTLSILKINEELIIQSIKNYFKDPFLGLKAEAARLKLNRKKFSIKNKKNLKKALKDRIKSVFKNPKKTLPPIIIFTVETVVLQIIGNLGVANNLIDKTNTIIEEANASNDPVKLNNAKIARDNAIKVIQKVEEALKIVNTSLESISLITTLFSLIEILADVVLLIPVPSPAPDVVTVPKETFRKKVYEPAINALNVLSAYLPIVIVILENIIQELEEAKGRLLPINGVLEQAATSGTPGTATLISNPEQFGTTPESYKGFKFAIKEENSPNSSVKGFKRHYAVAIDTNNVEVLKSELSFTLDPNDLIESLKLIIDQQKLIA